MSLRTGGATAPATFLRSVSGALWTKSAPGRRDECGTLRTDVEGEMECFRSENFFGFA